MSELEEKKSGRERDTHRVCVFVCVFSCVCVNESE